MVIITEKTEQDKKDILYIYRKLVANLTKINGFDGWMIVKAEFKTGKVNSTGNNKFIKQRKIYSIISTSTIYNSTEYMLIMHIVKPYSISGANSLQLPGEYYTGYSYLFSLEYTKDDIKRYIEYTGDSNSLHMAESPVVPGFLMLEDIIAKEVYKNIADNSVAGYTISFKSPVFADEIIEIYRQDNGTGKIIALKKGSISALNPYASRKWELNPL